MALTCNQKISVNKIQAISEAISTTNKETVLGLLPALTLGGEREDGPGLAGRL